MSTVDQDITREEWDEEDDWDDPLFAPEEEELDEKSRIFFDALVDRIWLFIVEFAGIDSFPYPYQEVAGKRIIESVVRGDGQTITALFARQSGKTELLANVISGLMVLLPKLALLFPNTLGKFKRGFWVGCFAPTEEQVSILFSRVVDRLTSEHAELIMSEPEINDAAKPTARAVQLKGSGSLVRMQTANPRAKIEGRTYHFIVIDECFPAGTPVLTSEGWVPIDVIAESGDREWIVATQVADELGWGRVRTAYKTPRHTDYVRVVHEHGSVICTANHPFVVGDERVPAIRLTKGAPLSLVPGAPEPAWAQPQPTGPLLLEGARSGAQAGSREAFSAEGEAEPARSLVHAGAQPDAVSGDTEKSFFHAQGDGTQAQDNGRERQRTDRPTEAPVTGSGTRVERRICYPYWRQDQGRTAYSLQARSGSPAAEGGRRSRRRLSRNPRPAGSRPTQTGVVGSSRVVSVEVLQPGDPVLNSLCESGDFVYTLEVESDSHTYVAAGVLVGNCQDVDEFVVTKSIRPMKASTNGTIVEMGTPTTTKGIFYKTIQINKRIEMQRGGKRNHFEFDYHHVSRANKNYRSHIRQEALELGEDSDEFRLAYKLEWLLDRGMFITEDQFKELGDTGAGLVHAWLKTPVLVGVDPARKSDSTVVTVVWVDWQQPDGFGFFRHHILNWLEMHGEDWEEQYFRIVEFLANYNVLAVAVDAQGVGDAIAQRLQVLMPDVQVVPMASDNASQSQRWKHLMQLIQRQMITWPAHPKVRRLKVWKRFQLQMGEAEKKYDKGHMLVEAPDERGAHDDFVDSLALAAMLTKDFIVPAAEQSSNPMYSHRRR